MKKQSFPSELLVYVYDYDNGKPLYAVAENVDDIPEDTNGQLVAVYLRRQRYKFTVRRELN